MGKRHSVIIIVTLQNFHNTLSAALRDNFLESMHICLYRNEGWSNGVYAYMYIYSV
jgi:hypothetical protein